MTTAQEDGVVKEVHGGIVKEVRVMGRLTWPPANRLQ
jgi:hypothetical protein